MTNQDEKDEQLRARPSFDILPGSDRNATDQGQRHSRSDTIGPDTTIVNWDGNDGVDTYDGPNRSENGDSRLGKLEQEGYEFDGRDAEEQGKTIDDLSYKDNPDIDNQ